jgi:hypothetical protein
MDRHHLNNPTVVEVLRTAVEFISHGQTVTLIPDNQAITSQRAADILGMSRPFFIKRLESGLMAHHRVVNQRRVYLRDVLEFAALLETFPDPVIEVGRNHRASLTNPVKAADQYLTELDTPGLGRSVIALRELVAGRPSVI